MITKTSPINFCGYKNLISTSYRGRDYCIMYMAMCLDNEGESRDLDKLHEIKQILTEHSNSDDIFTVTYARYGNKLPKLYFDDFLVNSDTELKSFRETTPKKNFQEYENLILKLYTFIAQMTKELMHRPETAFSTPSGKNLVMAKYESVLRILTENTIDVKFLVRSQQSNNYAALIAKSLNEGIQKRMLRYFK